jgi:hypothetical protein
MSGVPAPGLLELRNFPKLVREGEKFSKIFYEPGSHLLGLGWDPGEFLHSFLERMPGR